MRPRRICVAVLAVLLLLASCSSSSSSKSKNSQDGSSDTSASSAANSETSTGGPAPATAQGGLVAAKVGRATPVADANQQGGALVRTFGGNAYRQLVKDQGDAATNLVFSPYSIVEALAMTSMGAKGQTATQMEHVLNTLSLTAMASSLNGFDRTLAAANRPVTNADGGKGNVSLDTANAVWGQQGYPFERQYLEALATYFDTGVHTVNYKADVEAARRQINSWVAAQTKDRIKDLLGNGALDEQVRLVLTNALYLKAPWNKPFDKTSTEQSGFRRAAGADVLADFMSLSATLRYQRGDGWQSVTLPYAGEDLAMTIVLPDARNLSGIAPLVNGNLLQQFLAGGADRQVDLRMPKFRLNAKTDLVKLLQELGMTDAFDASKADFSGIAQPARTREPPLLISKVLHQANITVDEEGTEAAASTAVIAKPGAAAPSGPPIELTVDHPFLFVVQQVSTRAPLLIGQVTDPTAE